MELAGLLALAAALLSGCIFSPDRRDGNKPPPPPPSYLQMSRPQNVLANLRTAYEARDSSGYRQLFELDYQGSTYDTDDQQTGNQPGTFTRIDEEKHIRSLAENANISSVTLDLGLPGQLIPTPTIGDTGELWALVTVYNPRIGFNDGVTTVEVVAEETFEFMFRPRRVPRDSSETDTLWHIVRWNETP